MNDAYDVLKKLQADKQANRVSKEEFAEQMKEKREDLNQLVDKEIEKVKTNPQAYLNYLEKQAMFDQYTVTNTLLIMAQKPEATLIKSSDKWREDKTYIRKGEKGFSILEPTDDYKREDGTFGKNYRMKSMFDISQLAKPPHIQEKQSLSVGDLIRALSYKSPVGVEVVTENNNGKDVFYSMEDKKIYVKENLAPQEMISGLATEFCFVEVDPHKSDYTRNDLAFSAMSSAYMLCKKYGMELPPTDFANDVSNYLGDLDSKEVKSYLSDFKETFDDVSKRMENGLYAQNMNKEQERHDSVR